MTAVYELPCTQRARPVIASNVAVIAADCYWKVALGEKHSVFVIVV